MIAKNKAGIREKSRNTFEYHAEILHVFGLFVTLALLVILFVPSAFADESMQNEFDNSATFEFQHGVLRFDTDLDGPSCDYITPDPKVKTGRSLNIDGMEDYFFIILGKTDFGEYQYLQIQLPEKNEKMITPSYLLDFKKQDEVIRAGLYQDYNQLAIYMETDKEPKEIDYNNYQRFLIGQSKQVSPSTSSIGPGMYDMHAILFQSDKPDWINDEACAISLHWTIEVGPVGYITTKIPQTEVGRIYEIDEEIDESSQENNENKQDLVLTEGDNIAIGIIGKTIEGQSHVGSVAIYNLKTNSIVKTINNPEGVVHGQFGQFILSKDEKLIISAPWKYDENKKPVGAIYILDGKTGALLNTITNPEPKGPEFGISITSIDDKLIVGAPDQEVRGVRSAGAVYVFDLTSGSIIHTIENPNPATGANFGLAVANLGENFVVGYSGKDVKTIPLAGAISIYDGKTGSLIKTLQNPDPEEHDQYGYALTTQGDLILTSSPSKEVDGKYGAGVVYLIDSKTGSVVRTIPNPDPDENAYFGMSLLFAENKIFVGAPGAGLYNAGAVYVFDQESGLLIETINNPNRDRLLNSLLSNQFGFSLAYSDGKLAIGDQEKTVNQIESAGTVYIFDTTRFSLINTIGNPDPHSPDLFGQFLTFVGETEVSESIKIKHDAPESPSDESEVPQKFDEPEINNYNIGTIRWIEKNSSPNNYATIELVDPDLNKSIDLVDVLEIRVFSTADKKGVELAMVETGKDTGVFYGDLNFSLNNTLTSRLKVSSQDLVSAEYIDMTLPAHVPKEYLPITATLPIITSYQSPHLQEKEGIPLDDISCKPSLVLIQKFDLSPACVKPESIPKLVERGWAR